MSAALSYSVPAPHFRRAFPPAPPQSKLQQCGNGPLQRPHSKLPPELIVLPPLGSDPRQHKKKGVTGSRDHDGVCLLTHTK
uniref:Uncharacterized protein n=1 Tax=Physcomitrium patens TaxID=3218 RepID=A0A2K1JCD6_PHYPA|nr:hypothetical protein PHYPA_019469 [Physcomitrium patens]